MSDGSEKVEEAALKNLLKRLLEEAAAASKAKTRYQGMDTGNIEPEKKQRRKRSLRPLLPIVAALLVQRDRKSVV